MQQYKKVRWTLRLITLAVLIAFILIYTVVYLNWWIFAFVPAFFAFGIAWVFPAAGGLLMLVISVPGFYKLYESSYDFQTKLPAYVLCLIFIASGFMHIAASFWRKRAKIKPGV